MIKIAIPILLLFAFLCGCGPDRSDEPTRDKPDQVTTDSKTPTDIRPDGSDEVSDPDDSGTGYLPIFEDDLAQNVISNRMQKNFARLQKSEKKNELFQLPSAGLLVYRPPGTTIPKRFTGFEYEPSDDEDPDGNVQYQTNPFSMKRVTERIVRNQVYTIGAQILFTKSIRIDGKDGIFYASREKTSEDYDLAKYTMAFGDDDFSWIITGAFKSDKELEIGGAILKCMLNTRISDEPRLFPGEDVRFRITPGRLVLTDGFIDKVVFTLDGRFPTSDKLPIFQALLQVWDLEPSDLQEADRKKLARSFVSPGPGFRVEIVSSFREVTIDELEGYECVAVGTNEETAEPLQIYSVSLFDGGDHYLMQGWVSSDNQESFIADFRALANSFRRKNRLNPTESLEN